MRHITNKILAILTLCAACGAPPTEGDNDMAGSLDLLPEAKLGNEVEVRPGRDFIPGPPVKVLDTAGAKSVSDKAEWLTVGVAVYPQQSEGITPPFYAISGPFVAEVTVGNGGVSTVFEIDLQPPRALDIPSGQGANSDLSGSENRRLGITYFCVPAGTVEVSVRNDANNRTLNPDTAAEPDKQGSVVLVNPVNKVRAWVVYGQEFSPGDMPNTRTYVVSNGLNSGLDIGVGAQIPIPNGARQVKFYRNSLGQGFTMSVAGTATGTVDAAYPPVVAGQESPLFDLPHSAVSLSIGAVTGPITTFIAEFRLEI